MFIIFAFMFLVVAVPSAMIVAFSRSIDRDFAIAPALRQAPASPAELAPILAAFARDDRQQAALRRAECAALGLRLMAMRHDMAVPYRARAALATRDWSVVAPRPVSATVRAHALLWSLRLRQYALRARLVVLRARKALRWAVACSPVLRGLRRLVRPVLTREVAVAMVTVAIVLGAGFATVASLATSSTVASAMVRQ